MSIARVVMCIKCISSIGHCGFNGVNTKRPKYLISPSQSHECFHTFGDVIPPRNCLIIASEILIADRWYCSVVMVSEFCKNAVCNVINPRELIISRSNEGSATKSMAKGERIMRFRMPGIEIDSIRLTQFGQRVFDVQPILQILEHITGHLQNEPGTLKDFLWCVECVWRRSPNLVLIVGTRIIVSIGPIADRTGGRWTGRLRYVQLLRQRRCDDILDGSFVFDGSFGGTCQLLRRDSGCRLIWRRWFQWFALKIAHDPSNCVRWQGRCFNEIVAKLKQMTNYCGIGCNRPIWIVSSV